MTYLFGFGKADERNSCQVFQLADCWRSWAYTYKRTLYVNILTLTVFP